MKYLVISTLMLTLLGFNQPITSTDLNGKWVDVNTKTDTLTFESVDKKDYLILGRGNEMQGGRSSSMPVMDYIPIKYCLTIKYFYRGFFQASMTIKITISSKRETILVLKNFIV